MSCPVCNDTGKVPGSDYLDCCKLGCNAAVERADFNKRLKEAGSMSVEDAAWWGYMQAKNDDVVANAKSVLIAKWDDEGACSSCGWHALLGEHDVSDEYILDALANGGVLRLGCLNKDDEHADSHRGIKIDLTDHPA